ncbi:MAG: family 1 glycosylhydrolase [Candidatus Omnitrophica bacterium]|nr:family 1 glycosylhydrolase [Candidatus Omnitrophota bacterium]MDD5611048.1 family 1 glycosylhydrolase [Candidatus Omnitrophota bacterium]
MLEFPKEFFWGSAIAAHQVEGGNIHNDWWDSEIKGVFKFPSGNACRHYELFRQDFDLARQLNQNALRFSIEWSRVEPRPGEFNEAEIQHYKDVVLALRERKIEPVITLHHFTNPVWFNQLGGWQNKKAVDYFLGFVEKVVNALSSDVKYWVTINEPMIYLYFGYSLGIWPPHKKGILNTISSYKSLVRAHVKAYRVIHTVYKNKNLPEPKVSIAANLRYFMPCKDDFTTRLAVHMRDRLYNFYFLEDIHKAGALDYIGVNYYTKEDVPAKSGCAQVEKNSLGWDIYPAGFYELLLKLKKFKLPVFILENGICTVDDDQRWKYIYEHLKSLHRAMEAGIEVLGYLYWSLMDNFEWDKGFGPRFGLIDIDYNTYERKIRESAQKYAQVCLAGRLV